MGCTGCSTNGGTPKGCKSNGSCGTSGCNKLTVFDWLSNMDLPSGQQMFDWVEVRFKNGRKDFFQNVNNLPLYMGDEVAVEASPGHDIGVVALTGELVRLQMKKKNFRIPDDQSRKIYRKASQRDIDKWREAQAREFETMVGSREIARKLGLNMKISDVEYQGDGSKATFYYTADDRVDFRQLIKDLASAFGIRIEMRQIGARQEAARLGGLGSCGRELCCSTWLTDFRSVNTAAARYQQLSLNPLKLAGQCGKLKCCLNYELDSYMDALKSFPEQKRLKTKKGEADFMKMDIFKQVMWFAYPDQALAWVALNVEDVHKIQAMNAKGELPEALEDMQIQVESKEAIFVDIEEESLTRFDRPKKKKKPRGKPNDVRRPDGNRPEQRVEKKASAPTSEVKPADAKPENKGNRPNRNKRKPRPQNAEGQPNKPENSAGGEMKTDARKPNNGPSRNRNNRNRNNRNRRPNGGTQGGENAS